MASKSSSRMAALRELPVADEATLELRLGVDQPTLVRLGWAGGFATVEVARSSEPVLQVTLPDEFARSFAARVALLPWSEALTKDLSTPRWSCQIRWTAGCDKLSESWESIVDESEALSIPASALLGEIETFVRASAAALRS